MAIQPITKEAFEKERKDTGCSVFEAHARLKQRYIKEEIEDLRLAIESDGSDRERRLLDLIEAIITQDGPRG